MEMKVALGTCLSRALEKQEEIWVKIPWRLWGWSSGCSGQHLGPRGLCCPEADGTHSHQCTPVLPSGPSCQHRRHVCTDRVTETIVQHLWAKWIFILFQSKGLDNIYRSWNSALPSFLSQTIPVSPASYSTRLETKYLTWSFCRASEDIYLNWLL